jgi:hypothetical protein
MQQGVCIPDVPQELISQALAFAGSPYQTGNIKEFDGGLDCFLNTNKFCELIEPEVWNRDYGLIRFDCAEGIIGYFGILSLGENVEKGAFANIWEPDDSNLKCHRYQPGYFPIPDKSYQNQF